jgi:hypothetical protein
MDEETSIEGYYSERLYKEWDSEEIEGYHHKTYYEWSEETEVPRIHPPKTFSKVIQEEEPLD